MQIKFKRLSEKAVMPVQATKGSSGFDLTATHITTELNECGQLVLVYHTDIAVEIPEGFEGQLRPRSSISKKSLRLCNAPGTIDSDYRGEVTGKFISTTDVIPAVYKEGERFAQLVIAPVEHNVEFIEVEELQSAPTGSGSHEVNPQDTNQTAPGGSGEAQSGLEQAE